MIALQLNTLVKTQAFWKGMVSTTKIGKLPRIMNKKISEIIQILWNVTFQVQTNYKNANLWSRKRSRVLQNMALKVEFTCPRQQSQQNQRQGRTSNQNSNGTYILPVRLNTRMAGEQKFWWRAYFWYVVDVN